MGFISEKTPNTYPCPYGALVLKRGDRDEIRLWDTAEGRRQCRGDPCGQGPAILREMVRVDLTEKETVEQQVNVGQLEEPGGQREGPVQRPQVRSSKWARVPRGKGSVVDRRPPGGLGFPSEMPASGGV